MLHSHHVIITVVIIIIFLWFYNYRNYEMTIRDVLLGAIHVFRLGIVHFYGNSINDKIAKGHALFQRHWLQKFFFFFSLRDLKIIFVRHLEAMNQANQL